jgi:hypothetical protein
VTRTGYALAAPRGRHYKRHYGHYFYLPRPGCRNLATLKRRASIGIAYLATNGSHLFRVQAAQLLETANDVRLCIRRISSPHHPPQLRRLGSSGTQLPRIQAGRLAEHTLLRVT